MQQDEGSKNQCKMREKKARKGKNKQIKIEKY